MSYVFPTGWVDDRARVQESIFQREADGQAVMGATFAARHNTELPGTWARMKARGITGIFLRDRELIVNGGKYRRPFLQRAGTCVSRAFARGCQTSLDVAIADNIELLRPVEISFAPIYSLARVEIGRNRVGYGDGAIMADAAAAVSKYGVASTENIMPGRTEDQIEAAAVKYATPGQKTPVEWLGACNGNTCQTFWPETLELLFDCIAAGYASPFAHGYITSMPNPNGISDLGGSGNHARCFTGVFIDANGVDQLVCDESWGAYPCRSPMDSDQTAPIDSLPRITLRYAGGEKRLPPGSVGVNAKRFWGQIQQGGECWSVGPSKFESDSMADLLKIKRSMV